jgi:hypothetical protein
MGEPMTMPRYAPCGNGCGKMVARVQRRTHEKVLCQKRPSLAKAQAPPPVPAQSPPQQQASKQIDCGCGRFIIRSRMYMHAAVCDFARAAGHIPPPVRRNPCKCGCGGTAVSRGVKTAEFIPGHYERWVWRNRPERREKVRAAKNGEVSEATQHASDVRAIAVMRREEARLLAEGARTAALIEAGRERSFMLWGECLGVSLVLEGASWSAP